MTAFGLMMGALTIGNDYLQGASMFLYGFGLLPIIGIGNSFAAMQQLPISPAATCGLMLIFASIIQSGITFLVTYLTNQGKWPGLICLLACCIISNIFGLFVKSDIEGLSEEELQARQ